MAGPTLYSRPGLAEATCRDLCTKAARMTPADLRALTPLVWGHVSPYGAFDLDLEQRLDLDGLVAA